MVHLLGVNLPDSKLVRIALTYFHGVGEITAENLCSKFSIHRQMKIRSLTEAHLTSLANELSTMTIENDLKKQTQENILRLRRNGSYRGLRHALGFPVRGQNTHNNAKTAKRLNTLKGRSFSTISGL